MLLAGCSLCVDGPLNAPDLCGQPLADAGLPAAGARWAGDPQRPDPTTRAAAAHPGRPHPVLCTLDRAFTHSPACVESMAGPADGIDNDCDGTIDEGPDGNGGHPAPPPVPKSSAFVLPPGHTWTVEATGAGCGRGDCRRVVAEMSLTCPGVPRFEGTASILPRRDDACLLTDTHVCGAAEAAGARRPLRRARLSLPPIVVIWLSVELFMSASVAPREDFGPYTGPLVERSIAPELVHPHMGFQFSIVSDTPRLQRFERWLRTHPIYVRSPGEKYIVFGMKAWDRAPGEICVFTANILLPPSDQPLGPWLGHGGDMLKWAFAVVDHYGFDYAPERQYYSRTRQALVEVYSRDSVPVDWRAVADRLRATGRPVPDDLFDEHD